MFVRFAQFSRNLLAYNKGVLHAIENYETVLIKLRLFLTLTPKKFK